METAGTLKMRSFLWIALIALELALDNTVARAQWVDQQFLPGQQYQISFPDKQNGFILGDPYFFATADSGLHWTIRSHPGGSWLFFLNKDTALCAGYYITKTTDGGMSWYQTEAPFNPHMYQSVFFVDSGLGWVVGNGGTIMRTTDCGETWEGQQSGTTENLFSTCFVTPQDGWAVGFATLRTTDGGSTWNPFTIPSFSRFTQVFFTDPQHGFVLGDRNLIVSTNSGSSWVEKPRASGFIFFNFAVFRDSTTGWAAGYGDSPLAYAKIFKTTDAGTTWELQFNRENGEITSLCFTDSVTGWAVGSNAFLKTANGGLTFLGSEAVPPVPRECILAQNYPNPFNPTTAIRFELSQDAPSKLQVYGILGNLVATLVDGTLGAGAHLVKFDGSGLSSGIYVYRLTSGPFVSSRTMTLMK